MTPNLTFYQSNSILKDKFNYTDQHEFVNGFVPGDDIPHLLIRESDTITDAMVMCWEKDHKPAIQKYVKNFNTVVQAGGFNGLYPALLGKLFKTVYTFEPDQHNFFCLVNNCQFDTVVKLNAALGNEHKMIQLDGVGMNNPGTGRVADPAFFRGIIPMFRLDDFDLEHCDLIMLDIENYELNALRGAFNTIEKFKPVICFETSSNDKDIAKYLSQWGYEERQYLNYANDKIFTVD